MQLAPPAHDIQNIHASAKGRSSSYRAHCVLRTAEGNLHSRWRPDTVVELRSLRELKLANSSPMNGESFAVLEPFSSNTVRGDKTRLANQCLNRLIPTLLVVHHSTMASIKPKASSLSRILEYEVGYATSAYKKCCTCGNRFALNELRLGVTWQLFDTQGQPYHTTNTYWYHLKTTKTRDWIGNPSFCFHEWALRTRRIEVELTMYLQHLKQEDSVAVTQSVITNPECAGQTPPARKSTCARADTRGERRQRGLMDEDLVPLAHAQRPPLVV
jgi:hypothetical protein